MQGTKRTTMLAIVVLLTAGQALAGGFNIYEAGAKATALGGAFTATADDGSAIFYNPAGLAFLEGSGFDLNLMPILPGAKFTGAQRPDGGHSTGKTVDQTFPIPGLYYYQNRGDLALGIGVYAPFGLGVEWDDPENWIGRALSYNVDLATVYVSPTIAWKINDQASLSMGVDIAHTSITLNKYKLLPGNAMDGINAIDITIEGDSEFNFTPSFGAMIKATDKWTFGAMYHHSKKMAIKEGTLTLTNTADPGLAPSVDGLIASLGGATHTGSTMLKLPHMLSLGTAYQFSERLRGEFDMVHFGWSTFSELALDFGNPLLNQTIEEAYKDVWQYRVGVTYQISPALTGLAGYVRDETPQPVESMSPLLPDSSRNDWSFGLAWQASEKLTFTGTFMAVLFEERTNIVDGEQQVFGPEDLETNPGGTYDSFANIFGIGVGYKF